ncbi:hypothetical protein QBC47DRAFT_336533 [Echria macrotheca]|uniref:Uncharacterized protein n=1 Tax=Echria macrotheca TaxID=438768 RepID=A0AAJ0BIK7_9PEZI|nr:hypothetical protein QBC47DRAFT_336533 [Echria macrotheca]
MASSAPGKPGTGTGTGHILPHYDHDGLLTVTAFEGAITTSLLPFDTADLAFSFRIVFRPRHPRLANAPGKPPMHFHVHQDEYLRVLRGALVLEMDYGGERVVRPRDGDVVVPRGEHHRLYTLPPPTGGGGEEEEGDDVEEVEVLLWGEQTESAQKLDLIFFENWYAYQEKVVVGGEGVSLLQVLIMFDAAGTYLSLPRWVPFRVPLAKIMGVVGGRWIGSLMGYQPYYEDWTTDWDLACETMETSWFWRRFAVRKRT